MSDQHSTRRTVVKTGAAMLGALSMMGVQASSGQVAAPAGPRHGQSPSSPAAQPRQVTRVARFEHQGRVQWGLVLASGLLPLPGEFASTGDFIRHHDADDLQQRLASPASGHRALIPWADVALLSPVTRDQQFICQGANYRQHMIESGLDPDAQSYNMIFTKATSCIVPAHSELIKPARVRFLDYEIELGLILKRDVLSKTVVTTDNLHDYIAGMVIVNDYSARDIQIPQSQFYKGKSFRTFGPVGPFLCLLTRQDMPQLYRMQLTLTVNGEVRQRDSTANWVHGPAATLTELSGVQDLYAGDLLSTGTPAGCALSVPSPLKQRLGALLPEEARWAIFNKIQEERTGYLKAGDLVEARIRSADGSIDLGVQRNRVVDEDLTPAPATAGAAAASWPPSTAAGR